MKILKWIFYTIIILLLLAQFIPRPTKNISSEVLPTDIRMMHTTSPEVAEILKTSCLDCHSNNTIYPWYSKIQPAAIILGRHINEGKKELNFSEFGTYNLRRQYHKMEEVEEEVKGNEMPITSFTLLHAGSKLNENQKEILIKWSVGIRDSMRLIYPADSLKKIK